MLKSFATKKYKKAFKLAEKQKKDLEKLEAVLMILSKDDNEIISIPWRPLNLDLLHSLVFDRDRLRLATRLLVGHVPYISHLCLYLLHPHLLILHQHRVLYMTIEDGRQATPAGDVRVKSSVAPHLLTRRMHR